MYDKKPERGTPMSDEGNKKLIDAKNSKLESPHQEEQLNFLQVCIENGHEKKSNEMAINLGFNMAVSNRGKK